MKPDDDYPPYENFGRKRLRYFGAVNCFVCIKEELDTGEYGAGAYPLVADVAAAYFDGITKLYRSFSPEELKSDTEIPCYTQMRRWLNGRLRPKRRH